MSASGQQQEWRGTQRRAVRAADPAPDRRDGAVEIDERRAKMERLRAEGIDPYPHVSLLGDRTLIKDVLAAHDASALEAGEHPSCATTSPAG